MIRPALRSLLACGVRVERGVGGSRELVLVGVAELLEYGCGRLRCWRLVVSGPVHAQMVMDNVGHSLCVGSGARPAAPDGVVDLCEFVGDAIRNVGPRGRPAVGGEYDTILEVDGHAGSCQQMRGGRGGQRTWKFLS